MTGTRGSMFPRRVRKTGYWDRQTGFTLFELTEAVIVAGLPATVLLERLSRTCRIAIDFLSRHQGERHGVRFRVAAAKPHQTGNGTVDRGFATDAIESIQWNWPPEAKN
jgi:hypothetical protein